MAREFKPFVTYNEIGDQLEVHWSSEMGVGHWVNSRLTLMRSMINDEIIGLVLTGFRSGFIFSGFKLDKDVDESPPLTPEEREQVDKILCMFQF